MKKYLNLTSAALISFGVVACSGGGSSSGGGNSPQPAPGPVTVATSINIGNITTIPTGNGSSGNSSVTVSNNLGNKVILQKATYTLSQNGKTEADLPANLAGSPVDVSQCSSIGAHGVCSLQLSTPGTQGQYTINLEYLDTTTGKVHTATNVVGYSEAIPATDTGVRYSSQNNNVYNEPGGTTTLTIPFQLTRSFGKVSAKSNNDNPVFAPTVSCPGNSYSAGTLCNLYVKVSNTGTAPMIVGGVSVYGEELAQAKSIVKSANHVTKSSSLKGDTGYLFGAPITVSQNAAGNLVTSAINTVVSPSNGSNAQTITLLNNGAAMISNIQISGATPVVVTNSGVGSCSAAGNSLAANASCTFTVNVTSVTSGQAPVTVNYNNGAASGNTSGVLAFNVIYIASEGSPALTITTNNSLLNIPKNTTATATLVVKNTSSAATLNNIKFTPMATPFTYGSGSCLTNGTQNLTPGTSCTLVVNFAPTTTGSGTLNVTALGDWTSSGGSSQTYSATSGFAWSAIEGDAFFYITPNYVSFAIRADGVDEATQTFKLVNAGLQAATINSLAIPTQFTNLGTGTCVVNNSLAVNGECTINVKYGPTTSAASSTTPEQLTAGYKPNGNYTTDVTAFANLDYSASLAALVEVDDVQVTGTTGTYPAFSYVNTPATPLAVEVTYTNNGTASANNFNVALNNLPVGYASVTPSGTPCKVGELGGTLATGASCNVKFQAVNPTGLYNPFALSGSGLSFNIPGFSYTDTNTKLNVNASPTFNGVNAVAVTTSLFATVGVTPPTPGITAGSVADLVFSGPTGTIITIPASQLQGFTVGTSGTCTIGVGGTCPISVEVPASFPAGTARYIYYVSPTGTTPPGTTSNSIIQSGSFDIS